MTKLDLEIIRDEVIYIVLASPLNDIRSRVFTLFKKVIEREESLTQVRKQPCKHPIIRETVDWRDIPIDRQGTTLVFAPNNLKRFCGECGVKVHVGSWAIE